MRCNRANEDETSRLIGQHIHSTTWTGENALLGGQGDCSGPSLGLVPGNALGVIDGPTPGLSASRKERRDQNLLNHGPVIEPLDDSVLVSADAPLWHFIHTVQEQPYRLVVEQTRITGIVTWSDLLKVPVLVLAFSLVVELGLAMNRRILEQHKADKWVLFWIKMSNRGFADDKRPSNGTTSCCRPSNSLTCRHKAKLLRGMLGSGRDFDGELAKVVKLRNDVDHVKDIVRSEAELKRFVEHLETAEAWVPIVKSPEALASPGFIPFCERYSLAQVPSWKVTEKVPCNPAKN